MRTHIQKNPQFVFNLTLVLLAFLNGVIIAHTINIIKAAPTNPTMIPITALLFDETYVVTGVIVTVFESGQLVVDVTVVGAAVVGIAVVGTAVVGTAVVGIAVVGTAVVGTAVVGIAVVGGGAKKVKVKEPR